MKKEQNRGNGAVLSSILLVARTPFQISLLKRVIAAFSFKRTRQVSTIAEAEAEVERKHPDMIVMDVSDLKAGEFETSIKPFLSKVPVWIKTFLIDTTAGRKGKARAIGAKEVASPIDPSEVESIYKKYEDFEDLHHPLAETDDDNLH